MRPERLRFRDIRRTSAFRLTVLMGAIFALGLLALLGLVYAMTARELTARSDRILHADAARLLGLPPADLPRRVHAEAARGNGLTFVELVSGDGEHVAGNILLPRPIAAGRPVEIVSAGTPMRLIATRTAAGETIVVGRDISQIRYLRGRILLILASSGIVILGGVAAAATLLAIRPLRRVRDLERAARQIAAGRFETRMPIAGLGDELDQFAATVNVMIEEMGRVIAQVKGVTDAVAHDLRTPLTRVRAQLDRGPHAGDTNWAALAAAAVGDLDLVLARFAALLRIAEIETGARRAAFAPVDLSALAAEVHALYEPLADDRGIALHLAPGTKPAVVEGDRRLLFEAVSNLVDNAIKFGATAVTLAVAHGDDGGSIVVRDDGGGIAPGDREAVLRRFHRGTNAKGLPGMGLGLSIVAAIAHLHGLELRLEDGGPGLVASLVAPAQVKFI